MKKYVCEFCKRGLVAMGFGPIILAIIYAILGASDVVHSLDIYEVVLAIISIAVLAFIAAGIE